MKKPDKPHIRATVYFLKPEEGGRRSPVFSGYRPMLWFGDMTGEGTKSYLDGELSIEGVEQTPPGSSCTVGIRLLHPEYLGVKLDDEFELCEGSRVIGRGRILEVHRRAIGALKR